MRNLSEGDAVVVSAYTSFSLFHAIKSLVKPGVSVNLWMWNPVSSNKSFEDAIQRLKELGVYLHSFEERDASRYEMTYHHSFYNMSSRDVIIDGSIETDFYFLGAIKNRMSEIKEIYSFLNNYKTLFIYPKTSKDFITYHDNLLHLRQTRCVVEVMQQSQVDITLRPLEALAFKKKLLTNNPYIKRYDFYHPNNIFILGEDDPARLNEFVNTPFHEIDVAIVKQYDINTWVDSFIHLQ